MHEGVGRWGQRKTIDIEQAVSDDSERGDTDSEWSGVEEEWSENNNERQDS